MLTRPWPLCHQSARRLQPPIPQVAQLYSTEAGRPARWGPRLCVLRRQQPVLDGLYNGVSGLVRLAGGQLADRGGRHKAAEAVGYGLSALRKPALLVVHSMPLIGA